MTEQVPVVIEHPMHGRTAVGTVDAIILRRGEDNTLDLKISAQVGERKACCSHITLPEYIQEI